MAAAQRRPKGEGGLHQRHDHPSCPDAVQVGVDEHTGKPILERPEHRCRGRWTAQVDLGWIARRRVRKTVYGRTRKEAQIKLAAAIRERDAGALVVASPTVEVWLNYWLDVICPERGLKTNTMRGYRSSVRQYHLPHLGRRRVDKLQPEHLRAMYAAMRADGLSEGTLRQAHAILHRALKVAVREGKAQRNVAELIDPPTTAKKRRQGLTVADARRVLQLAGWGIPRVDLIGLRWFVALYLGLRQGEALGLRWSDVDLQLGTCSIEQTLVRKPGVGLVFDTPKSAASRRVVPLPPVVASRFAVAWAQHVAAGGTVDDLVFTRGGRPIDHRADWQAWTDLLAAAGVEHVALHAARNTTASLLEAAGVSDRMVAEILGQSSVVVTHGYQGADLERRRDALLALESYVDSSPPSPAAVRAAVGPPDPEPAPQR